MNLRVHDVPVVLLHSPLVGPFTWRPVAEYIRNMGTEVFIPTLRNHDTSPCYWKDHAWSVSEALRTIPPHSKIVLAGHSGAGSLLPSVRESLDHKIIGYIFVDAIIPRHNCSRLDQFSTPAEAKAFRSAAQDGKLPVWKEEHVQDFISDPSIRRQFVRELAPMPLAVYEEKIPVPAYWPDAPCAFLHFSCSDTYLPFRKEAEENGWLTASIPGRHFHMLEDPETVGNTLLDLMERLLDHQ
ncbi:hypothetical protein T458_18600 [Brevibacillus panacihumi W25]|uniref:AB hydrolase-1 domain-containing protein n=1 Tax=Brevibacillus panacihumi W25 TaxID=1408254 RepID=V6MEN7_9BACL|nr:alpha/beta hydrolase [Brevibacillus panacihumi]EST53848.1 hypothetical protein T458_18600 [Brevibacillus panacihumi W25]